MLDVNAIEAALAKMTPEPWGVADYTPDETEVVCGRNGDLHVAFYNNNPKGRHDAAGIALLRNAAPEMIRRVREQDAAIERLERELELERGERREKDIAAACDHLREMIAELRTLCGATAEREEKLRRNIQTIATICDPDAAKLLRAALKKGGE